MSRQKKNGTRQVWALARVATIWALLLVAHAGRAQEAPDQDHEKKAPEPPPPAAPPARASGLRVGPVVIAPRDEATATVRFDITWSKAWHHGVFHDAAWVFFKVRPEGATEWQPVRLVADKVLNPAGYGQDEGGTPLEFVVPDGDDGFTGMFVRRAENGVGVVAARNVTAVWDFTTNAGVTKDTKVEMEGFGVEMVYVPEGPFYVGKGNEEPFPYAGVGFGGMEQNWLYKYTRTDGKDHISSFQYASAAEMNMWATHAPKRALPPYLVTGAGAIPTGKQKDALWAVDIKPEDKGEIPAAFPNGYAAFYCMKFPWMTAGQYAGFLNMLTAAQAKPRYFPNPQGKAIRRSGEAPDYTYSAPNPDEKCPWLSWADGATYAAWAGLRPITELEYEKAIRGPELAVPNDAHPSYWGVNGVQSYHIYERAISIGDARGRAFAGTHGRGTPDLPADWPSSYLDGVVIRGDYIQSGHFAGTVAPAHLLIAGRSFPINAWADRSVDPYAGWRGARSAPRGDRAMGPFIKRMDTRTVHLARMKQPVRPDGVLDEWGDALLTMNDPSMIYPTQMRSFSMHCSDPWRGPGDMSVKAYLGWDGEALCVAAEVTDDRNFNTNTAGDIWKGDAVQVGLVTAEGRQTSLGLALTADGVVFHTWVAADETLSKTAGRAVVRDEAAKVTRYELRLALADIGLKPGAECYYYFLFFDNDGKGHRYRFQWAPVVAEPFNPDLYSRFVLKE